MDLGGAHAEVLKASEPLADESTGSFQPLPEADTSSDISSSTADTVEEDKTSLLNTSNDLWEPKQDTEDIKQLTESTIKMSGLDQWSVDDESKKQAPLAGPQDDFADGPDSVGEKTLVGLQAREPSLAPPPGMFSDQSDKSDTPPQGASADLDPPMPTPPAFNPPTPEPETPSFTSVNEPTQEIFDQSLGDEPSPSPSSSDSLNSFTPMTPQIDKEELEAIVKRQVRDTIQQMAREVLPDVAEKVIKDEIHRLLSNPPTTN